MSKESKQQRKKNYKKNQQDFGGEHRNIHKKKRLFKLDRGYKRKQIDEYESLDERYEMDEEECHIESEKCLDHEAEQNMIDYYVNYIDQWELDETPDSIIEDYVDLMIDEMEES